MRNEERFILFECFISSIYTTASSTGLHHDDSVAQSDNREVSLHCTASHPFFMWLNFAHNKYAIPIPYVFKLTFDTEVVYTLRKNDNGASTMFQSGVVRGEIYAFRISRDYHDIFLYERFHCFLRDLYAFVRYIS